MKDKIARRTAATTTSPQAKVKRPRRSAVNPTKAVRAVRSLVSTDRLEPIANARDPRVHSAQPTSFLTHSLQLRSQNLGRTGR